MEKIANGDQLSDEEALVKLIADNANPPPSSTPRIPRVPTSMVSETKDYNKYYVPKAVSIGPYHTCNTDLEFVENLKPDFAKKLLSPHSPNWEIQLTSLYKKLGAPTMVKTLRNFYQEKSTDGFSDKFFTKMMILDGCFILYYIRYIFCGKAETCPLNSHQIVFIHQDLFLLENQIPFQVLIEVMKLVEFNFRREIKPFLNDNFLASRKQKRGWFFSGTYPIRNVYRWWIDEAPIEDFNNFKVDHLLQFLHHTLTGQYFDSSPHLVQTTNTDFDTIDLHGCTFRNANELIDVGIHFKPSRVKRLTQITYSSKRWLLFAELEIPPIIVSDSTKPMLLNLIAHEMCSNDGREAWVTSYVCFLDSLINQPEDVEALRKAGVLYNSLGSDNEVANLFNEIGTGLKPNFAAYSQVKNQLQNRYETGRNTCIAQLTHDYMKSPWAFAFLGAVIALLLSAVQTYFTVWSPKGECDDLCTFLKINHHL